MTKEKEKHSYIFPDLMSNFMKKVDMQTQLEASLMSMSLIMIGMTLMAIYLFFFIDGSLYYKGLIIFNLGCAFLFISSFLITTYQQYVSYMDMMGIDPSEHKAEIKRRGNIIKRIYLAIKNRKSKDKINLTPMLIKEALNNQKLIEYDKKQSKTIEKEVR